jgi:hypothetical protein
MAGDPGSACRRGQETRAERENLAAGFKQSEEVKFLEENYFVRFKKAEAAKDRGPQVKSRGARAEAADHATQQIVETWTTSRRGLNLPCPLIRDDPSQR